MRAKKAIKATWRWSRWVLVVAAGVALGVLPSRAYIVHSGQDHPTWADAVTAVSTGFAALTAVVAALVAYREYAIRRKRENDQAGLRCDVSVTARCFDFKGYHLVWADVRLTNRSTSLLDVSNREVPPFVAVQPVLDEYFGTKGEVDYSEAAVLQETVLESQLLDSGETLAESYLLPVSPKMDVAAYRVEFGITLTDSKDDVEWEWSAVTFVPVNMTPTGYHHPRE